VRIPRERDAFLPHSPPPWFVASSVDPGAFRRECDAPKRDALAAGTLFAPEVAVPARAAEPPAAGRRLH